MPFCLSFSGIFCCFFYRNDLTCYKPFEEFRFLLFVDGYLTCCCRLTNLYCITFTSEHFRVSNLNNHNTLRIKVKKKYSECIWRFEARKGIKVKSASHVAPFWHGFGKHMLVSSASYAKKTNQLNANNYPCI
jgi:hypothetical protein